MPTVTVDAELAIRMKYNSDIDPELELLGSDPVTAGFDSSAREGLINAPIFTGDALDVLDVFPQRALYGRIMGQECKGFSAAVNSPKLFINANAPFSAITCGVQGSGKSHSTSVLLESCLIRDERLGTLPAPLSALLFHFSSAGGGGQFQPCEAAYLASLDETRGGNATPPKVTVLVMPNTLRSMKKVYADLPQVSVEELHFAGEDMNGERLLAMMKVDQEQHMPLYMECIMSILRSMESAFDFSQFCQKLSEEKFSPTQKAMLDLRLKLLKSCLEGGTPSNRVSKHFNPGQLTIIDLSSPFMDGSSACGFFEIILGLFIEAETKVGKIVVLDEAHKYLTTSGSSSRLTDSLLSVIRQQRHLATRVIISTQEPTVVPATFLDLCSLVIAHRFSSPKWLEHLKQHIPVVDAQAFSRVFTLKTGEAMIFAPSGVGLRDNSRGQGVLSEGRVCAPFGPGYLLVRSRERITKDGGRSQLAAPVPSSSPTRVVTHTHDDAWQTPTTTEFQRRYQGSSVSVSPRSDHTSDSTHSGDTQAPSPMTRQLDDLNTMLMELERGMSELSFTYEPSLQNTANIQKSPVSLGFTYEPSLQNTPNIQKSPVSLTGVERRFRPLVTALDGQGRMAWSSVGEVLKLYQPPPYQGKLKRYLELAADAKVVQIGNGTSLATQWVQLPVEIPREFIPLLDTMRRMLEEGHDNPWFSAVAANLKESYPHISIGRFKPYALKAEDAGLVICDPVEDKICWAMASW